MIKAFFILVVIVCLSSCEENRQKNDSDTIVKGDIATTISTDTGKLAKIIDLSKYKPTHAKFKYSHNNSGGDRTIPAPSESNLEAILYFDSTQYNYLKAKYFSVSDSVSNCARQNFDFNWLDGKVHEELLKVDTSNKNETHCFKFGFNGKLWLLKNKILMFESRN